MHLGHSFFDKVAKVQFVTGLIKNHVALYNWFDATRRQVHAIFNNQSQAFDKGGHVVVIKGGESCTAHFFAAQHSDLHMMPVYRARVALSPYVGARVQSQR